MAWIKCKNRFINTEHIVSVWKEQEKTTFSEKNEMTICTVSGKQILIECDTKAELDAYLLLITEV